MKMLEMVLKEHDEEIERRFGWKQEIKRRMGKLVWDKS